MSFSRFNHYIRRGVYILGILKSLTISFICRKRTKKAEELADYIEQAGSILKGIRKSSIGVHLSSLLIMKRISDICDEDYSKAFSESKNKMDYLDFCKNYRLPVPENCHWEDMRKIKVNVGEALQNVQNNFVKAGYVGLEGLFQYTQWNDIGDDKLIVLIEHLSIIELSTANVPDDLMDICYDHILRMADGWCCYTIIDQMKS